jgi:phosphoglycolate phosphatase
VTGIGSWASYDAYLFDLDGTLIDTAPDIDAALNHCLQQAGLNGVEQSLTRHWVGHGSRMLISQALQHQHVAEKDIDALLPEFLAYYKNNIATHSQIYPGVIDTLQAMKNRNAKLAVVTNKLTELSMPLLEQIGMLEYFDLVVCGDTAGAAKPDPAPVNLCLDTFSIAREAALFVGDSDTDVKAAQAAGVAVVCMRDGYNHGVDVTTLGADGVIDHFTELSN